MKLASAIGLGFTLPIVIVLALMGAATITVLVVAANQYKSDLQSHIITEEQRNLETRTQNVANLSKLNFERIMADVEMLEQYASRVYQNSLGDTLQFYPNYHAQSSVDPNQPPPSEIGTDGKSIYYSVWFNKFNSDPNTQLYLFNSSLMDNVWRSMFRSSKGYAGLYVGFEDGLFRNLPWERLDQFSTLSYVCLTNNQQTTGYDPRCRNWYINARNDLSRVKFTEPYIDAGTGNVLISASKAFNTTGDQFVGVVSVDISMQKLAGFILSESGSILQNGYTYLIDVNNNVVVHPEQNSDIVQSILDVEFVDASEKGAFSQILSEVQGSGTTIQRNYSKNGEQWVLTSQRVGDTGYTVAMVVPFRDITNTVSGIQTSINTALGVSIAITVLFVVIMIIASIFVNRKIAGIITEPITEMDNVAQNITQGRLDVELGHVNARAPELSRVFNNFERLIHIVRYANAAYFQNNLQGAYDNYCRIEQMLTEVENRRGLGIVWNNKGVVLKDLETVQRHLELSEEHFDKAIKNAEQLESEADQQNAKFMFKMVQGDRWMNLGLLYEKENRVEDAINAFRRSIDLHRECDNKLGEIKTKGNLGQLFIRQNRHEDAMGLFTEAYGIATERFAANDTEQNRELLCYSSLNMGIYTKSIGEYAQAIQYFNYALSLPRKIDLSFKGTTMMHLAETYDLVGQPALSQGIRSELSVTVPKHVLFVLDCSGSMDGSFIKQCRDSISTIVTDFMNPEDIASLCKFSSRVEWVFQSKPMDQRENLINDIQTRTPAKGRTAFYLAVYTVCRGVVEHNLNNKDQFVVALTDGEDNESGNVNHNTVSNYVRDNGINLIVITVGQLNTINEIQQIVHASPNGVHIPVNNGVEGIRQAFGQVATIINRGHVNIESF